jgi:hypothetical protein
VYRGVRRRIYREPVAGGDEEPLLVTDQNINTADISPDGRVMFFSRADPRTLRISGPSVSIRPMRHSQPRWRHDGRELFYLASTVS